MMKRTFAVVATLALVLALGVPGEAGPGGPHGGVVHQGFAGPHGLPRPPGIGPGAPCGSRAGCRVGPDPADRTGASCTRDSPGPTGSMVTMASAMASIAASRSS